KETEFYQRLYLGNNNGETITFDDFYKPLDLWIEVTSYSTRDGYSILIRDKSVRKKAEVENSKANERFVRVTEATQDAIWDWDIVNDMIYRSNNIVNFYGKDALSLL